MRRQLWRVIGALVGTLVGQVGMFGQLASADIGALGHSLGIAVVATMYGAIVANAVAGPLAKANFRPALKTADAQLLILVFWGSTQGSGDIDQNDLRERASKAVANYDHAQDPNAKSTQRGLVDQHDAIEDGVHAGHHCDGIGRVEIGFDRLQRRKDDLAFFAMREPRLYVPQKLVSVGQQFVLQKRRIAAELAPIPGGRAVRSEQWSLPGLPRQRGPRVDLEGEGRDRQPSGHDVHHPARRELRCHCR